MMCQHLRNLIHQHIRNICDLDAGKGIKRQSHIVVYCLFTYLIPFIKILLCFLCTRFFLNLVAAAKLLSPGLSHNPCYQMHMYIQNAE